MNLLWKWAIAGLAALAIPASGQSPAQLQPATPTKTVLPAAPAPTTASTPAGLPQLTKADVDSWLDGFMPYALRAGGIPGAVVVVVKDGQPLTMRGFGYADAAKAQPVDPNLTMFRPGSTSKLFTWTAVMQQVQAGKLDLDKDINAYLDFKIPAKFGKPITLRHLMTHTGGFAETAKNLIAFGDNKPDALGKILSRDIPERIYAPGTMPAYSNYGASLAGYIVERVSGEPFNQYVQRHIFAPLGMAHSSFDQPLPMNLRPLMARGYMPGSVEAHPFEVIGMAPAGAMSSTGSDMARFMIAMLNQGGPLIQPAIAQQMYGNANRPFPNLPAMGLGFYHEDRNGLNIVGHGGDTVFFHSDLHLILDKGVGLYISMNSVGKEGAAHPLREQLFHDFTNRYFPAPSHSLPTMDTAREHAEAMAGHYVSSRASGFNFLRMAALLGQTLVSADQDGVLTVSSLTDPSGTPRRWREVAPWLWQEINGSDQLQAVRNADGSVKMFSITPFAPIIEFLPAPASLNARWIIPAACISLLVMLIAAFGWPTVALINRRYNAPSTLAGRPLALHRAARITAWLLLILAAGWMALFMVLSNDLSALDNRLDIWMRLLQLVLIAAAVGTVMTIWNAWTVARAPGRHVVGTLWAVIIALAAAFLVWLALDLGLLTVSLNY